MKVKCEGYCGKHYECIHKKVHEKVDSCGRMFCPYVRKREVVIPGIVECKPVDKEWVKDEERKD